MSRNTLRAVAATAAALALVVPTAGSAAAAPKDVVLRSGDGDTLRARFYEHAGFGGAVLSYYGSTACTSTYADNEYSASVLPTGWNDQISSVRDYNSCDVNLYWDAGFQGQQTGYVHYGSVGRSVPSGWNDRASSFRIS